MCFKQYKSIRSDSLFFPNYLKVLSDKYLERFKKRADDLGMAISGMGAKNNFTTPDSMIRREGVDLAK